MSATQNIINTFQWPYINIYVASIAPYKPQIRAHCAKIYQKMDETLYLTPTERKTQCVMVIKPLHFLAIRFRLCCTTLSQHWLWGLWRHQADIISWSILYPNITVEDLKPDRPWYVYSENTGKSGETKRFLSIWRVR